jgi:hypothetical protein
MADWKQITARIRRARTSKDPFAQLSALFEKTRDAMVAFELGKFLESTQQSGEAVRWYSTAAEKFRRSDWKTKAQDAITRLGGAAPAPAEAEPSTGASFELSPPSLSLSEPRTSFEQSAVSPESVTAFSEASPDIAPERPSEAGTPSELRPRRGGKRRRGRRGGRNRGGRASASTHSDSRPPALESSQSSTESSARSHGRSLPSLPVETAGELSRPAPKGRYGDPGLSSRITLLEMQFRRLLSCEPVKLDRADRAAAGPGVFLLTDDDMTSYYYVEACDSLRAAITQLARSGAGKRGSFALKQHLAEHLDIPETRASKYLAEHCVVRWLQLDEGAQNFAHFAIAVLRPALNE